jgi:hypothetical protein
MRTAIFLGLIALAISNGLVLPDKTINFISTVGAVMAMMDMIDFLIHVFRSPK